MRKIDILIPLYYRFTYLEESLKSIESYAIKKLGLSCTVKLLIEGIDKNAIDNIIAPYKHFVKVVDYDFKGSGVGSARKRLVESVDVTTDYFLMFDDDIVLREDSRLDKILNYLDDRQEIALGKFSQFNYENSYIDESASMSGEWFIEQYDEELGHTVKIPNIRDWSDYKIPIEYEVQDEIKEEEVIVLPDRNTMQKRLNLYALGGLIFRTRLINAVQYNQDTIKADDVEVTLSIFLKGYKVAIFMTCFNNHYSPQVTFDPITHTSMSLFFKNNVSSKINTALDFYMFCEDATEDMKCFREMIRLDDNFFQLTDDAYAIIAKTKGHE